MHLTYLISSLVLYIYSIITFRRSGIGNRLKIAPAATGSVDDKLALNKSESINGIPKINEFSTEKINGSSQNQK